LTVDKFLLGASGEAVVARPVGDDSLEGGVVLRRFTPAEAPERWLLLAPPRAGVWTNGHRVSTGLRQLRDRDEIRLRGAQPVFFSTEELPRVTPFPGSERASHCPRCREAIVPGSPAVRCPSCHTYHHEAPPARGCWSYAPTCSLCEQGTALNGDYQWRPEELAP